MGKNDKDAMSDLRKCAVNFVLHLGTDPLLNTVKAKASFTEMQGEFYQETTLSRYLSWESDKVVSSIKTKLSNGKNGLKITKAVRVNKKLLTDDLVAKKVIVSSRELSDQIGMPTIMVVPELAKGRTPLQVLDTDPLARHAAAVIESYLTARQYEVVVPNAVDQLNAQTKMQGEISDVDEDPAFQLAIAMGSDIYLVFAGMVYAGNKVSLHVKAYETTTARLLGSETGYSAVRIGPAEPLVEEAVNSAIDKVLQRLVNYWQEDARKGIQYKLVFRSIAGDMDETVQEKIISLIEDNFALSKENIISGKTIDYNVWAKKSDFSKSSTIYNYFRDEMKDAATLQKVILNKKLIIIGVEGE
jgi:hypothetical protein